MKSPVHGINQRQGEGKETDQRTGDELKMTQNEYSVLPPHTNCPLDSTGLPLRDLPYLNIEEESD